MSKDLVSGIILAVVSGALLLQALELEPGTATSMGAGYLPRAAAAVLFVISLGFIFVGARREAERVGSLGWRAIVMVSLAIVTFAVLMPRVGLLVATVALVVLSSLAGRDFRSREVMVLAAGLCVLVVTLFVYMLGLPMKVI